MKFELSSAQGLNTFTGYGDGYVLVNGRRYANNLIVLPDSVQEWAAGSFETLTPEHFSSIALLHPEIALLGTGERLRFPHPSLTRALASARIGFEVMDTGAVCRTYNILAAEGRRVAAAVLFGGEATGHMPS